MSDTTHYDGPTTLSREKIRASWANADLDCTWKIGPVDLDAESLIYTLEAFEIAWRIAEFSATDATLSDVERAQMTEAAEQYAALRDEIFNALAACSTRR